MAQIKSEAAYRAALKRIDELLPLVNDNTPTDDRNYLELDMISDINTYLCIANFTALR
jgi:HTH-type transcriptional regulator/antitoxin HigA